MFFDTTSKDKALVNNAKDASIYSVEWIAKACCKYSIASKNVRVYQKLQYGHKIIFLTTSTHLLWKLNWSALIAQSFMFWVSLIKMVWKSRVQKRQQNVNFAYHKYKVHNMEDGGVDRTIICYQQHHTIGPNGTLFFFLTFLAFDL